MKFKAVKYTTNLNRTTKWHIKKINEDGTERSVCGLSFKVSHLNENGKPEVSREFTEDSMEEVLEALDSKLGKVCGHCRNGGRSKTTMEAVKKNYQGGDSD